MKRALLNLHRVAMSFRHTLPVILLTLVSLSIKAQCPPIVTATPATASVCAGDSVIMACTPSTGTTWQWYKDGVIMPGETDSVCYAFSDGNYTVMVGGCLTPSNPIVVSIKPLPFVSLSSTPATICSGQNVTLTVTTGPNVTWVWINPPSIFGSTTNPLTQSPSISTLYQVVGADITTNCANTTAITVAVYPPLVSGTVQADVQVCPTDIPPLITSTAATGSNGVYTYQWQMSTTSASAGFNNIAGATGTSYQPGPALNTRWYRLVTSSPPCPDVISNAVVVQVNPNPVITSPSASTICSGVNVNYHPTSNVAGTTFNWTASVTSGTVTGFTPAGNGNIHDVLSVPAGSPVGGQVTYVITPVGPAPSNCTGTSLNFVVTVNPLPTVTNASLSQSICAGTTSAPVVLTSNVASTTFTWSAAASVGLSGYQPSGSGSIPAMTIFSSLMGTGTIQYTITPHGPTVPSCAGPSVVYTITVNPSPIVTNSPMQQTICTENTTNAVTLTSNIPSTTYTWTATAVPAGVSGFQGSGTSTIPAQTITNTSNVQGVVTYHIIPSPSINGCLGIPSDYVVYVNPKPVVTVASTAINLCSGSTTNIVLSSNVAGTTFSWTASAGGVITGFGNGTGNVIAQTLLNTSNAPHDVTYIITPTSNGCVGDPITVIVTVDPSQVLTVIPAAPVVCSGNNVIINLIGNVPGITFTWTATAVGNVTGYSNGSGPVISQTLFNNDNVIRTVNYAVIMNLNGCSSGVNNFIVTVYPTATVTNSPLSANRCSGTAFNLAMTSSVAGSTYSWTANGTPGILGYAGGMGGTITQTLTNTTNSPGTVIYTITPTANGCPGTPSDFTVTVDPIPDVNLSLANQYICSGTNTAQVDFSSSVAGTTFTWAATPSGGGITGYTASGSAFIPTQVINSTLSAQGTVIYTVTPSMNGCNGTNATHTVTINPLPLVTNPSMTQRICTGTSSANVNLLSNVAGTTFSWIATPSSASISGYQSSGGNTIPPQIIMNSSSTPGTVTYQIIPTSNFGPNCVGTSANYTITVDPSPIITSSLNESVCSGQLFNYTITGNLPGSTFTWSRAAVTGISNSPASGSTASINEILINTTPFDVDVQYVLTPVGQAPGFCVGNPSIMTLKVRALPQVNAGTDLTIPYGIYTSLNGSASGGTGALNYTWTPNSYIASGGNSLTPQTVNLTSTRTYMLTVNDAAGCSNSDQMTVFVVGTPIAAVPTATPADICLGGSTILSANTTGGSGSYSYTWTSVPAGFTSNFATVSVSPLVTTIYTVTADDGFNTSTASVTVNVNPLPTQYTLTGGGSYCTGGAGVVVGLAGSQSGVTYQLYNNGNPIGIPVLGNGASISFGNQTLAGSYTVTATRTSTGCSQDMGSSVVISINPLPVANAGVDQVIPYGTSTTLIGSSSGGFGTMNYAWNPITYIASGANTFSPLTTNLYSSTTFTLIVTDANGCTGTDQVSVALNGSAINVIATAVPDQICADTSQSQLHAFVTGGAGVYTYSWTCTPAGSPAWSSTLQNPMISPDVTTNYTVTADDGFNTAVASVTVIVNPLPLQYSVTGGGSYCFAGSGVSIGLSGSQPNTNYQLYRGGVPDGPAITGNGTPISFGNRTAAFTYTVIATNNLTGCSSLMNGSATIIILPPPPAYMVTGGGSYPQGGPGREVGLMHGDNGVSYQLYCNNAAIGSPVAGNGSSINFGYQTSPGTYTVIGTDISTGCSVDMIGSVNITVLPLPLMFNVIGGGIICEGASGLTVQLTGSELGIDYQLLRNGFPYGALASGTNSPLTWGPFIVGGMFEVRAINATNGSTRMMNDSAVITVNPAPTIYTMNPTGSQCPGTILRLNGSDAGINYFLLLNGVITDTLAGTGIVGFLDFGPQIVNGTYTVKAVNPVTGCQSMMNGSAYINISPQVFNVLPAGILCPGQVISLSGSEPGVNYQLRRNGTFDMGAPVPGNGTAIDLGTISLPGLYSVIAIDATTNCVSYMNDSSTLFPDPTSFTIVPDGAACEGEIISLNGSEVGVDYVLLLDNAIHIDTISGTGLPISFGAQLTEGNYTIIAINQTSYCQYVMNGTTVMNDSPVKYSILPAGLQCVGTTISLTGSQTGIFYQLMLDGIFSMGSPVTGTGGVISFGSQTLDGTYTVRAVNTLTGCNTLMSDSVILEPLPVIFTVFPSANHCQGTSIGLNGSELNVNYILVLNGTIHLDTLTGTGNSIDFGSQMIAGTYTIAAYNTTTFCSVAMEGNSIIEASPVAYAMTPAGIACKGSVIGLASSETGISYQLRWNGNINIGAPVAGTGSPIDFGPQDLSGIYTVIATNANGCFSMMNSSVEINPNPVSFNLIPSGTQCQGTSLGIDGSELNANYVLVLNGNVMVDTIPGTGSTISFGPQLTSGNYTVIAYFTATNCQSTMNGSSVISNVAPAIYSMTPAGIICAGATIGLDNSEIGATYQLRMNGTVNMGAPVAGTGSAIVFGEQTLSGVYTVIATNSNGCSSMMSGSVVVNPNPTAYNITPSGGFCPGTVVGVDGSETGVNYVLVLDGSINIDTLAGNGGILSFGLQTTSGVYTVVASNATTLCQTMMNGQTVINPSPIAFNMTPAGIICAGATIGLDNSEIGVTYQLRLDACINIGIPVSGTGSAITFGTQMLPGTYTIIATNIYNCSSIMSGSIVVNPLPIAYNITPSGIHCQGTTIGVDGSEPGVNYILVLNGSISIDTLAGNGASISFGQQLTSGTYTITAYNTATNCQQGMNGITTINSSPLVFNLTPAGSICTGAAIGIDGSETGVNYQLRRDGTTNIGAPVAGTGSPISFGVQTAPGTYSVEAAGSNGCASVMNGSIIMNASPVIYTQAPSGNQCPGVTITLNGSETGTDYILYRDGVFPVDTISGTGSALNFGEPVISGSYSVTAITQASACPAIMNGSTTILSGPTAYNVTPAGINCSGSIVGLDGSEAGVTYQLRRDGITNVGAPLAGTGSAISFGVINIPGTYTIIATNSLSGCAVIMNGNAVLQPKPLAYSITAQGMQCAGTSIILNGSQAGTDYVLVMDNTFPIDTLSGTGNILDFGPQFITGTYTIEAIGGSTTCQAIMNGSTQIMALPAAFNITPAGIFCSTAVLGLDGSETGVEYTLYKNGNTTGITIPGNGSPISFGTQTYGDYTVKAVNLTSNCSTFMPGSFLISVPAQVNAGADVTICSNQTAMLNATVVNGSAPSWSTSGDGSFNNTTTLIAIYTPGAADIAAGTVNLLLTANGTGSCSASQVTDTLVVTIDPLATANLSGNIDVCSVADYTISGASATNYSTINWITSGTGSFVNGNTLAPTYTPSAADLTAGSVNLTMMVTGNSPCSNTVLSSMFMSFHPIVTVNAGPDTLICNTCSYIISTASVQNAASTQWSTSGTGSFDNASNLYATYTPSTSDYAQGSVVLSLTASNDPVCPPVTDLMVLNFDNNWGVDFTWGASCEGQSVAFTVNPAVTNIGAVASWNWNFGDGNTSTVMNPAHLYPGTGDYNVTLTAIDTTGYARTITHVVFVSQLPVSLFTYSPPNCSNETLNFTDLSHTVYGYISEWIWNYGDGSANDTIVFPDDPNAEHLYNASGTFNVTLSITNSFGCKASMTLPVDLIEAPVANYQYTNDCSGQATAFQDASFANGPGNTVQYWWDFGDPSTGINNYSDLKDATHLFSSPGTYQVTHIVRNFNNCTDTIVKPVTILAPALVDFLYDHTCVDGVANFSPDTSVISMAEITGWIWDFGDGVTNNQPYTTHVYSGPGSYQVTLTVTDLSGCTASKTRTVVVNPLPVAMFNTPQLPCEDSPVHFDDVSTTYTGYIVQWNWDFGDGNTQQIMQPANADTDHTYSAPGTYTVKLTIVSSDSCTAEREQTIVINPAPVANFDYENACQGTPAKFTDLTQIGGSGIINGWAWNFGDDASGGNNISTLQNPYHTYTSSGTYQVTLTVSAANGCSSTIVKTIVITDAPFVDFSYDNHCVSNSIQFTPDAGVISSDVSVWNWSFGDGVSSSASNPQHTYNTPGNYIVTLTITNSTGCANTISHTIDILPAPVANFSTSSPACSQHQVDFTNLSSASVGYIMSWEYNFGDGTTQVVNFPGNPNVSHTYSTYGNYNVTLTVVTNDNCSSTTSRYVQILQSPMANFDSDVNCSGQPAQFSDLSQGNPIAWLWNFGDSGSGANNTSNLQNPVHTYQQAGNYLVSLLVQNANGCQDTVSSTVSIAAKPVVDFSFVNGCAADTVHFISSTFVNVSTTSSWLWQFGDNSTSTEVDPYHVYLTPGTYSVSLTITNQNGCTNVKTRQVQVTAAPIAMFTSNSSSCSGTAVLFTDISSSPNGTINSWNWDFGDGTIVTVNAPANPSVSHTYTTAGIFNVVLTIHTTTGCEAYYTTPITINDASATAFSYQGNCNETPTYFTDLSQPTNGNSIISWAWNFGDPLSGINNTSNLPDPQHLFSGPGTYEVTLTTENITGCYSSMIQTLTISPEPAVDFIAPASCLGISVTFAADPTVTNLSDVASYLWDFGDGSLPSTLAEPEHIYSQVGTYSVSLTIANLAGCENSIAHTVTVHALPVAQFTTSGNCAGNLVQFTDISFNPDGEDIVGWSWDFGVGSTTGDTSTLQNPSFIYTTSGTYNVTLTVSSFSGCTDVKVMPVTVIPAPVAQYSYVAEPCHNGSVIFQDESTSPQSLITGWYWEFAPGVYSTLQNPVHVFGSADSCYNVKLVVTTANGCTDTLVQQVCVPSGLNVTFAYTQTCFGEPTWFTPTLVQPAGSSIAFCNWNFGDPSTGIDNESKLLNPQHTFSNPGTYIVSLQATDINNCSTTRYMSVTVDPLPVAAFDYKGGSCDSLVSFKNTTTGTSIERWIWNFGDGSNKIVDAPANPDVIHYYPFPGIYDVTLITLSEAGCSDTITKTIRRTPCISAEIAFSDTIVCQKRSMKFTETSICQAPIASWQWFFGDNTSATYTTQQPYVEHTYANAGKYTVRMVVSTQMVGGMVTDTASNEVVVKPAAKAAYTWNNVCYGSNTEFENRSESNNTTIKGYQWNFGDPSSSTDTSSVKHPDYKYDMSGEFDVKLVVTNTLGCTDTIVNKVSLYENPSVDFEWSSSCEAKPVLFTDKSDTTSSALVKWNWLFSKGGEILGASTEPNCTYSFAQAGIYNAELKITDRNGCSTAISKEVAINSSPVAAFSIVENYDNKQGQIMLNNGTINGTYYEWDFGNGKTSTAVNPETSYDKEGTYDISLVTYNGQNCADTLTMSYTLMYKGLFVPNAFNPGHMDSEVAVFKPKGTNLKTYYVEVRDRWGNLLWSSTKLDAKGSPVEGWDGKLHGIVLKQDVYLWKVSATFLDGEVWDGHNTGNNENIPESKTGTVTLIQ